MSKMSDDMVGASTVRAAVRALSLTVPIAVAALVSSVTGLLHDGAYGRETANWAAQAIGQDAVNLVVFPIMLLTAWRAARGSSRAHLLWIGLALYSAYSYLLYAGFVHFSPLFPFYVVAFGCSLFATIAGLAVLDPVRVRLGVGDEAPAGGVGTVLVVLGGMFALLWVSEFGPHLGTGTIPDAVTTAGLPSNPVWVLDLGFVLPAMVLAGLLLRRRRPLGYLLAVPLLSFGVAMSTAILGMFVALWRAGEPVEPVAAAMVGIVAVAESVALARFVEYMRHLPLASLVRAPAQPLARQDHDTPGQVTA